MDKYVKYHISGMDCASCATRIKNAALSAGVDGAHVSTASQILTLPLGPDDDRLERLENAVSDAGYRLSRLQDEERADGTVVQHHLTKSYRRALWVVIALNVGFGLVEMIGGYLSASQALKADALDFVGDGLITLLGLFAIGWSLPWRARSALIQGLFLGALGLGVVGTTAYRLFFGVPVNAGLMGVVALVALAVNVAAAMVLLPHRSGDANVKAVWHFSRNDALGNAAVVAAAGFVALSGSRWPDLIVAFIIAGLFLHSSVVIIRDASKELRDMRNQELASGSEPGA